MRRRVRLLLFLPHASSFVARRSLQSSASASLKPGLLEHYDVLVKEGMLHADAHQQNVVEALDNVLHQIIPYNRNMELYHAEVKEWEKRRWELREQMLQEEGEQEVRRQLEKKLVLQRKNPIIDWFSRCYKQLQQKLSSSEDEKEMQWQLHAYGQAATSILRKKRRNREVEPGAGRIVSHINREKKLDQLVGPRPTMPSGPKGLYIYGNVGCGKTMLMDMFFNAAEGIVNNRRRVHFHSALLEVHEWMHKLWKHQQEENADNNTEDKALCDFDESSEEESLALKNAIKRWIDAEKKFQEANSRNNIFELVADKILGSNKAENTFGGASLLCFDEMQVVDVFTAVALAGIFSTLIKKGTIIVATSNRAPCDLNKEGMQKELFDKFIVELQHHCDLVQVDSDKDYRRLLADNGEKNNHRNYFWPLNRETEDLLEQTWQKLVSQAGEEVAPSIIPVMFGRYFSDTEGMAVFILYDALQAISHSEIQYLYWRTLEVPQKCKGVARFSFEQLCDRPVGAPDYISLARHFHTVIVTGIPVMSMRNRDKARRFITLVDELYNNRRQMICTAATSIDELFLGSEDGHLIDLESLQFETEAEDSRSRRDIGRSGAVAPIGRTMEERSRIHFLFSGREELFAFQRAVSRLIEMQSSVYLQAVDYHIC